MMLSAQNVKEVTFSRSARGYKISEVDAFLEEVVSSFEELQNQQAELNRKIEVLAERIQDYREEEDSIRSALLNAQKSADKVLRDAAEQKERMLADARQQADDAVRLSQEKSVIIATEIKEKVTTMLNEAKDKASRIVTEAKMQAEQMLASSIEGCQQEKMYLDFLKEQEISFRQQLVEMYKKQFEMLKKGPEMIKELDRKVAEYEEPISMQQLTNNNHEPSNTEEVTVPAEKELENAEETISPVDYTEPEDIPLPVASISVETTEEDTPDEPINNGFEIKRKFSDIKFGDDYDISSDDDYDDYGV